MLKNFFSITKLTNESNAKEKRGFAPFVLPLVSSLLKFIPSIAKSVSYSPLYIAQTWRQVIVHLRPGDGK